MLPTLVLVWMTSVDSAGLAVLALLDPADQGTQDALAAAGDPFVGEARDRDAGDLQLGQGVGLLCRPVLLAENQADLPGNPKQVVNLLTTQEAHNLTAPPTRTWLIHYTVWMSTITVPSQGPAG